MKQRIRYVKKDNTLVSKFDLVAAHGSKYHVIIYLETMTYEIKNRISFRTYGGGEDVNNMNVLKRNIKKHLEHLGVEFEPEKRFRTFGRCNKGYNQEKHLEEIKKAI